MCPLFHKEKHVCVSTDERFPEYGKVEFVFSYGPEKIKGKLQTSQLLNLLHDSVTHHALYVFLRPGPPGERAERFCGLQHPGPPDPLGLVRELQPAL